MDQKSPTIIKDLIALKTQLEFIIIQAQMSCPHEFETLEEWNESGIDLVNRRCSLCLLNEIGKKK